MELVDLKIPKKTEKEMKSVAMPSSMERDQYPYGTRIELGEDQLAKMGELFDYAEVGEEVTIHAKAKISSKRANDSVGSDGSDGKKKKNRALEIQITKMHVACKGPLDKGTMEDFVKSRNAKK